MNFFVVQIDVIGIVVGIIQMELSVLLVVLLLKKIGNRVVLVVKKEEYEKIVGGYTDGSQNL